MIRLAILGSTRGTHLQTLFDAIAAQQLPAQIALVISNKKTAYILERARSYQLPAYFIDPTGLSRDAYDQQLSVKLKNYQIDLIVLLGYMRILSTEFVETWAGKIINVHPSLLPAFAGKMDIDVHRAVLAAHATETGCTVHYVTAEVDAGPALVQKKCIVYADDTVESLRARVQDLEKEALVTAIQQISLL